MEKETNNIKITVEFLVFDWRWNLTVLIFSEDVSNLCLSAHKYWSCSIYLPEISVLSSSIESVHLYLYISVSIQNRNKFLQFMENWLEQYTDILEVATRCKP